MNPAYIIGALSAMVSDVDSSSDANSGPWVTEGLDPTLTLASVEAVFPPRTIDQGIEGANFALAFNSVDAQIIIINYVETNIAIEGLDLGLNFMSVELDSILISSRPF